MKILRDDAVAVCVAIGFSTAATWTKKRMLRKLKDIGEMGNEGGLEIEDDKRLSEILEAIVIRGGEVELVLEGETEFDEDAVEPDEKNNVEEGDQDVYDEDDEDDEVDNEEKVYEGITLDDAKSELEKAKAVMDAAKAKVKAARAEAARLKKEQSNGGKKRGIPGPEVEGDLKGVRSLRNRLFFAGIVLGKHGLSDGLSDELIDKVDAMSEKSNKKASKMALGTAWNVVNGFLNG